MKYFSCPECQSRLSFDALSCWHCRADLGYVFTSDSMVSMRFMPPSANCANRNALSCNWVVESDNTGVRSLCPSCNYTRTIPPLGQTENHTAWRKLEQAKRYLLYSLRSLGLTPPDRIQQPATGLTFEFLTEVSDQPVVLTAHLAGVITINISEADDARREERRASLNEPYRTVLGHLRHEVGHFYWDQLIAHSNYLDQYRLYFGDERQNYDDALQRYYSNSVDNDNWTMYYVSRYASSHPWEDWAETWAYYMHVCDALDTAAAWNVTLRDEYVSPQRFFMQSRSAFSRQLTSTWPQLCEYLNAVLRSSGINADYPFKLPDTVIRKLEFVHHVISESGDLQHSIPFTPATAVMQ